MILECISAEIEHRELAGVAVREIVLTPRLFYWLLAELPPSMLAMVYAPSTDDGRVWILGVPVRKGTTSWTCRSCGADRERSDACTYCRQPYDRITIDGEILK